MVEIEEIRRDDSLDYLKILRALMQIPFAVGKNLLVDFLAGSYKNSSITKNRLDELSLFGSLHWERDEILSFIDLLIRKKMIEQVGMEGNSFARVLKVTMRGQNEVARPTLNNPPEPMFDVVKTEISDWDKKVFNEYDSFLEGLNDEQKKAVVTPAKRSLTIAGAGSGKTTVLVKRIEFLVNYRQVNPEEILAITFTRKARVEMEKRLKALGISGVTVATFNSFCEQTLRRYGKEFYGRNVRVLTYADKVLSLNLALYELRTDIEQVIDLYFSSSMKKLKSFHQLHNLFLNDCYSVIDYLKVSGQELYDFSANAQLSEKEMAQLVYGVVKYMINHKRVQGLRSFTDQIVDVCDLFKRRPSVIPYFEHVLVDEYQDVNAVQVALLKLVNFDNLFAVGDPRQSIFGWRGSDMKFILNFEDDFGDAEVLYLVKNYRSTKRIVEFINRSIVSMQLPDLESHHDDFGDVKFFSFENEQAEMMFVSHAVERLFREGKEMFVLARTNRQILTFAESLKRKKIPFALKTDDSNGNGKNGDTNGDEEILQITLATVHAIKGLEADHVFLIGANSDSFPTKASDHPVIELVKRDSYDKLEEERRLFYVALSRAKTHLYLTYTGTLSDFVTKEMEAVV